MNLDDDSDDNVLHAHAHPRRSSQAAQVPAYPPYAKDARALGMRNLQGSLTMNKICMHAFRIAAAYAVHCRLRHAGGRSGHQPLGHPLMQPGGGGSEHRA